MTSYPLSANARDSKQSGVESPRKHWWQAALLVIAVLLLGNWGLLADKMVPQWDAADFFSPQFSLVADHIKQGHLLLWDPWTAGGTPDLAEPEFGVTSPFTLLVAFLSPNPQAGFIAYWLCIWVLGAVGMLLFCKHLGAPAWGALVVALGFAVCGFYTGHAEHTSSLYSLSFVPWIVWRLDAAVVRRAWWPALQAGVLYGLSALGGYPELTILTALLLALWTVGRSVWTEDGVQASWPEIRAKMPRATASLVLAGVVGGCIMSPIYIGFMTHTLGYSDRVGPRARIEAVASNLFYPAAFSTVSSPYLPLLNLPPKPIWPKTDVSMTSIYMGSGILFFSLWAVQRRNRWRWYLAAVLLFFAACSVGNYLPVRGWLYDLVLPTRYFRNAALMRCYIIFLAGILAALGTKDLEAAFGRRKLKLFGMTGVLVSYIAAVLFAAVAHQTTTRYPQYHLAVLHSVAVWGSLAVLTIVIQLSRISHRAMARAFIALALVDASLSLAISRPTLSTNATLGWWHAENRYHNATLNLPTLERQLTAPEAVANFYPNSRNIPMRVPTLHGYITMWNRYDEAIMADPALAGMALGAKRFWFSKDAVSTPPSDPAFSAFVTQVKRVGSPILFLHTPEQMRLISRPPGDISRSLPLQHADAIGAATCSPADISNLQYSADSLAFDYRADAPGWLLVTDRWAPGWEVSTNGIRQPNFGADFVFRAVRMQRGLNAVRFSYQPAGFFPLVYLSWSILTCYGIGEALRTIRRKRQSSSWLTPAHSLQFPLPGAHTREGGPSSERC